MLHARRSLPRLCHDPTGVSRAGPDEAAAGRHRQRDCGASPATPVVRDGAAQARYFGDRAGFWRSAARREGRRGAGGRRRDLTIRRGETLALVGESGSRQDDARPHHPAPGGCLPAGRSLFDGQDITADEPIARCGRCARACR